MQGISPPMQHYDLDRTHTVESEKTYSMAFAKRQTKAAGGPVKRDKTPPQVADSEPSISLEGRRLDRDFVTNKENQPKKKKKQRPADGHKGYNLLPTSKPRSGPLDYEAGVERRPSIERGGTNTIEMEVSGVGSYGSSRGTENTVVPSQELPSSSQPQDNKEGSAGSRKRQKHSPAAEDTDAGVVQLAQCGSSKPPIPPPSTEQSANPSLSAPIRNVQKKARKSRQYSHQATSQESGYGTAGDETPSRRTSAVTADMDCSMNGSGGAGGGGGSPSESQLIELQPFNNPEVGLRESIAKIGSEDWSAKCNGMIGIRQVAMYHPAVLQSQLHSVVLAVQKEVGLV